MTALSFMEGYATSIVAEKVTRKKILQLEELNLIMERELNKWEFDVFSRQNREFIQLLLKNVEIGF